MVLHLWQWCEGFAYELFCARRLHFVAVWIPLKILSDGVLVVDSSIFSCHWIKGDVLLWQERKEMRKLRKKKELTRAVLTRVMGQMNSL